MNKYFGSATIIFLGQALIQADFHSVDHFWTQRNWFSRNVIDFVLVSLLLILNRFRCRPGVFIAIFEQISHIVPVFPLFTLNK